MTKETTVTVTAPSRQMIRVVALGMRFDAADGKLARGFLRVEDAEGGPLMNSGKVLLFNESKAIRRTMSGVPGSLYDVETDGASFFSGAARYAGSFADKAAVAAWYAQDRAAHAAFAARKESKQDPLLETLAPLRTAFRRLPAPARAQLLARIVHYLSAGGL